MIAIGTLHSLDIPLHAHIHYVTNGHTCSQSVSLSILDHYSKYLVPYLLVHYDQSIKLPPLFFTHILT